MRKPLLPDVLWAIGAPLVPPEPPRPGGSRPRVPDRACLTGILFVLKSGMPWEYLPVEMGCGSGVTCWRRPRDWQRAGVWDRLHRTLLDRLGDADRIDPAFIVIVMHCMTGITAYNAKTSRAASGADSTLP